MSNNNDEKEKIIKPAYKHYGGVRNSSEDAESHISTSECDIDLENISPTLEEKRMIIKHLLKNNFPFKVTGFFATLFILIGLIAIGLGIVSIKYHSVNFKIGNGIWAGVFSILNGLNKILCAKTRSYRAHVITQVLTPYQGLVVSIGLTFLSSLDLRQYHCKEHPEPCHPPNREVTIVMLSLGLFSLAMNIAYMIVFFNRLHGGWVKSRAQKLGFFQAYGELKYVCNCCCSKAV